MALCMTAVSRVTSIIPQRTHSHAKVRTNFKFKQSELWLLIRSNKWFADYFTIEENMFTDYKVPAPWPIVIYKIHFEVIESLF